MKTLLLCLGLILPVSSYAITKNSCVTMNRSVELHIRNIMTDEFGISEKDLVLSKTTLELLDDVPLDKKIAEQISRKQTFITYDSAMEIYDPHYHPRNLIVKYTYFNKEGKQNVFIASSIINDEECSLGFNGYITVKREF